jgi:hypothetical protein
MAYIPGRLSETLSCIGLEIIFAYFCRQAVTLMALIQRSSQGDAWINRAKYLDIRSTNNIRQRSPDLKWIRCSAASDDQATDFVRMTRCSKRAAAVPDIRGPRCEAYSVPIHRSSEEETHPSLEATGAHPCARIVRNQEGSALRKTPSSRKADKCGTVFT